MCVYIYIYVSCLCRPPSHWWISFIFYTIIGLDPEGGQWLFKFKSNHKKKINRQNAKQYMWDCSINLWSRKHTNLDTVVGFENEMVSAVPVTTQDTDIPRWTVAQSHAHMHGMQDTLAYSLHAEFGDSLMSVASVTRAHSNVFVGLFHWLNSPKLTRVHGNTTIASPGG